MQIFLPPTSEAEKSPTWDSLHREAIAGFAPEVPELIIPAAECARIQLPSAPVCVGLRQKNESIKSFRVREMFASRKPKACGGIWIQTGQDIGKPPYFRSPRDPGAAESPKHRWGGAGGQESLDRSRPCQSKKCARAAIQACYLSGRLRRMAKTIFWDQR